MAYATQSEIEIAAGGPARLRELADFDQDNAIDAAVIARAQSAADGWIDGFLRMRYATPIASPSETLKGIAADEAVYQMRKWRGFAVSDDVAKEREQRIKELEAMARGTLRPDEPLPVKSTAVKAEFVSNCGTVSRETLKGLL